MSKLYKDLSDIIDFKPDKEAVAFYVKELETLMSRLQSSCRQMKRHPCLSGSILIIAYIRLPKWQVWRLRRQSIVLM